MAAASKLASCHDSTEITAPYVYLAAALKRGARKLRNAMRMARISYCIILSILVEFLTAIPNRAEGKLIQGPESCEDIGRGDFSTIVDAAAQILGTRQVSDSGNNLPAFCEINGYVMPQVGFLLRLPSKAWNGKLIELGCAGFCGSFDVSMCDAPLRRGYACILSDFGHQSTIIDALWAHNNLAAEIDYGFRGAHVVALAGKALVERFYGQKPRKSYFVGASTGGRQALMEAQHFPWDFDGIIAGVPWTSDPWGALSLLWSNRALSGPAGEPLLDADDLSRLHQAVLNKCDLNDGVKDGVIGDPRDCSFDVNELRCIGLKKSECFTDAQITAVSKIYSGASISSGNPVYLPGAMKGSEKTWLSLLTGNSSLAYFYSAQEFRFCIFNPDPNPEWRPEDFYFERDYKRMGVAERLYDASNPDLRRFKAAGGKLLAYGGWNDAVGMPLSAVDYYEMVEKVMGGRAATQDFFRLFMIPGMGHGTHGDGATIVDWLSYLTAWVENGRAPESVISYRFEEDEPANAQREFERFWAEMLRWPHGPKKVEVTRPVYPYPIRAVYAGTGDPNDAVNFRPVDSMHRPVISTPSP